MIIAVVFLVSSFFIINKENPKATPKEKSDVTAHATNRLENNNSDNNTALDKNSPESINNNFNDLTKLPSGLKSAECGYYFESNGVCGGTCPGGSCVSEGRSCYCKQV